jgi:hypothetical protein
MPFNNQGILAGFSHYKLDFSRLSQLPTANSQLLQLLNSDS